MSNFVVDLTHAELTQNAQQTTELIPASYRVNG